MNGGMVQCMLMLLSNSFDNSNAGTFKAYRKCHLKLLIRINLNKN